MRYVFNIKNKKVSKTVYGEHKYSNLWYVCDKNKICFTFSPRGGCSISFQQYLDLIGLLNDSLNHHEFVHVYRCNIFEPHVNNKNVYTLIDKKYKFVKFIMNPYIRAVSIYRAQTSHNLSFREYLKQLINNEIDYFNDNDKYHLQQQYIDGEEKIITKYLKIDKNETFEITLKDGSLYIIDPNKYTSCHHGKKNYNNTTFCGDLPLNTIYSNLPASYKYFYDDEIKQMVETYYKKDIEKYGYSFDDF
jgi:hypothetical protein